MNAIDRLRTVASGEWGMAEFDTADCAELLQEIDRMRAEASETREACARICDERARLNAGRARRTSEMEAEICAAAIRAMGAP